MILVCLLSQNGNDVAIINERKFELVKLSIVNKPPDFVQIMLCITWVTLWLII